MSRIERTDGCDRGVDPVTAWQTHIPWAAALAAVGPATTWKHCCRLSISDQCRRHYVSWQPGPTGCGPSPGDLLIPDRSQFHAVNAAVASKQLMVQSSHITYCIQGGYTDDTITWLAGMKLTCNAASQPSVLPFQYVQSRCFPPTDATYTCIKDEAGPGSHTSIGHAGRAASCQ